MNYLDQQVFLSFIVIILGIFRSALYYKLKVISGKSELVTGVVSLLMALIIQCMLGAELKVVVSGLSYIFILYISYTLFASIDSFEVEKKEAFGKMEIFISAMIVLDLAFDDNKIHSLIVFGVIAGAIMQPFSDNFLLSKTLQYGDKKSWKIVKTPWPMALLWGIALFQLSYFWHRLDDLMIFWGTYIVFVVVGTLYFAMFELLVNNFTLWWSRKCCNQICKVAQYAILAEFMVVCIIPFVKILPISITIIINYTCTGIIISTIFIVLCFIYYEPKGSK